MLNKYTIKLDWILALVSIGIGVYLKDYLWIFLGFIGLLVAYLNPAEKVKAYIYKKFKKNEKLKHSHIEKESVNSQENSEAENKAPVNLYPKAVVILSKNKHNLLNNDKFKPKNSCTVKWG